VEIAPDYAEAWSNLGGLLLERWDFAGCVDVNRKASALRPDLTQAHYNEGLGHLYQGEAEEVVACFGRVVELDPNNAGGHYYLAVGLHAVGRIDEARVRLARSLALGWSPEPDFLRAMEAHGGVSFGQVPTVEIGKASKDSSQ
jgi:tetratricopeptide (TPR) repeat protein